MQITSSDQLTMEKLERITLMVTRLEEAQISERRRNTVSEKAAQRNQQQEEGREAPLTSPMISPIIGTSPQERNMNH